MSKSLNLFVEVFLSRIQIRFNTEKERLNGSLAAWRVLIDGEEFLAHNVEINVPARTTEDILPNGIRKWHISCEGRVEWQDGICTIEQVTSLSQSPEPTLSGV